MRNLKLIDEFMAERFYEAYEMPNGNILLVDDEGGLIILYNYRAYASGPAAYKKSLLGYPIPPSHTPKTWMDMKPQHDIDLIVLDLAGTILEEDKVILPAVKRSLSDLVKQGVKIATNSVASPEWQIFLLKRNGLGLSSGFPHFIIGNMREIHFLTDSGYIPYAHHNDEMRRLWAEALPEARRILNAELQRLRKAGLSVRREEFDEERRGIVGFWLEDIENAKVELRLLEKILSQTGILACNRDSSLIQIFHSRAGKGNTLNVLVEHWNISPSKVLCIGDSAADIPMLDRRHGFLSATVSNAEEEVKDVVRASGGYVASKPCGMGVLEILSKLKLSGVREKRG